nr:potassium transporter Kup [Bacteroidales bacterium]
IEDLVASGEITLESSYDSLRKHGIRADFKFVLIERIMNRDIRLTNTENFILTLQNIVKHISIPEERALQLDPANTIVEKVPILIKQKSGRRISPVREN